MSVMDASNKIRIGVQALLGQTEDTLGATAQVFDIAQALRRAGDGMDRQGGYTRALRYHKAADALLAVCAEMERGDLS